MSGGSYDYISFKLQNECSGRMHDEELDAMIDDLVEVLHELEWWKSSDSSEEDYREKAQEFKEKWFGKRPERTVEAIINILETATRNVHTL